MEANSELQRYTMLASFFLPEGILDWFDVVRMEETDNDKPAHELDVLYPKALHIYLDERDNRQGEELGLVANGFTEESVIHDYPARSRKMVLHVRRRRYKDADGHNVILCNYPLAAEGFALAAHHRLDVVDVFGQREIHAAVAIASLHILILFFFCIG